MPPSPPAARDAPEPDLEELLLHFDRAWQQGRPPRLEDHLAGAGLAGPARRRFLEGLVQIDLEYRWRAKPPVERRHLEDYLARIPELGPSDRLALELIGAEYRVRQRWGDRPQHGEYTRRFPARRPELPALLCRVDEELAAEFAGRTPDSAISKNASSGPAIAASEFLTALRQFSLLSPTQLKELEKTSRPADSRRFARDLLERGWLTAYQANQLLKGRAAELVLGPYLVLERLGEGGTGQVFKARHRGMNRLVALKLIRKELLADAEVMARFFREIQVVSQLDHTNIVHAYDAGPIGAAHVLVLEYVDGIDLARLVKQQGPLPVAQACAYVCQAASGLQHAHEKGLVHRDIKPSNLLITGNERETEKENQPGSPFPVPRSPLVKIADFGLARLQRQGCGDLTSQVTPQGATLGTPDYLAPEQALDFHRADIRADIYSLGCTLFYLLTGQPPFPGGSMAEKLARHLHVEPPEVTSLRPDVPAALVSILRRMLAKNPEDRYPTPRAVAEALQAAADGTDATERVAMPAVNRTGAASSLRRRWRPLAAGAVLLGIAGLVLLTVLLSGRPGPAPTSTASLAAEDEAAKAYRRLLALAKADVVDVGQLRQAIDDFAKQHGNRQEAAELLKTWPIRAMRLVFRPDGRGIIASDYTLRRWDAATGPRPPLRGRTHLFAMAISPDGKWLAAEASIPADGTEFFTEAVFWGTEKGRVEEKFAVRDTAARSVAFSPDSRRAAVAGTLSDRLAPKLVVVDLENGKVVKQLKGHSGAVVSVRWAPPDGRILASAGNDGARLWLVDQEKMLFDPLRSLSNQTPSVAFTPDGKTFALADGQLLRLWNMDKLMGSKGKADPRVLVAPGPIAHLAFLADGRHLLSAIKSSPDVVLWDIVAGRKLRTWRFPGSLEALAVAPNDRRWAVSVDAAGYLARPNPQVFILSSVLLAP